MISRFCEVVFYQVSVDFARLSFLSSFFPLFTHRGTTVVVDDNFLGDGVFDVRGTRNVMAKSASYLCIICSVYCIPTPID